MPSNAPNKCQVTHISIWCLYKALRDQTHTTPQRDDMTTTPQRKMIIHPYNTTTRLTPPLQRSSSHSIPMIALVIMVSTVPTPRGVSSPTPMILCPMDIKPRVGRTDISITLIPLRSTFIFSLCLEFCSTCNW